jgi:hypothetical protein
MVSDQDAARLHTLEEKADGAREALEQALLSLQAPEDHHGATQLALRWVEACDAAHRWVEYVLGFRRRDPTFAFMFFAETCLELYRGLPGGTQRTSRPRLVA